MNKSSEINESINNELKRLTKLAKSRIKATKDKYLDSQLITNLESRNEKIIKDSNVAFAQPYQYSSKFDIETKERLIKSYNRFLNNEKSKPSVLKKWIDDRAQKLNETYKDNQKSSSDWSKIFRIIDDHKDLSNILDLVGSGRRMELISEIDTDTINENINKLDDYIKNHQSDWDFLEIKNILTNDTE